MCFTYDIINFSGFYEFFDKNDDGHIDFKEIVCGISTFCRGLTSEQLEGMKLNHQI